MVDTGIGPIVDIGSNRWLRKDFSNLDSAILSSTVSTIIDDSTEIKLGDEHATWFAPSYLAVGARLGGVSDSGAAGVYAATRVSDAYGATPLWTPGQAVTAGTQRGAASSIWMATTSGNCGSTQFPQSVYVGPRFHNDGGVSWSWVKPAPVCPIAIGAFSLSNGAPGDYAWVHYVEAVAENGSTINAMEIAVKNKGPNFFATPLGGFGTIGIWLPAGADATYGGAPLNPSAAAIVIGRNSSTWNAGIVFRSDGLTNNRAIDMYKDHRISWFTAAGLSASYLTSSGTSPSSSTNLDLADWAMNMGIGASPILSVAATNAAGALTATSRFIMTAGVGIATVQAFGAGNIDLALAGTGTGGVLSYGTVFPGSDNSYALGKSAQRWSKVWTYDLSVNIGGTGAKDVSYGANDSGGAGFKVLRVAN